jgi:1-acyl-sn-glycerol-3-phosphate acyltransferase
MLAMLRAVQSLLFWGFLIASSVVLFPVALLVWLVTLPFDARKVWLHRFTCFWASLYTWLNPVWPVTIRGIDHFDDRVPSVLVANHLSLLDILVLFRLFRHFKWVSKIENFRVPLIGWNMSLNGYVKLERGKRTSVVQMFRDCERTLADGSSVMIFPEGTRSPTGRMRAFKPGAFEIALRTKSPIVPIALLGTSDALPKRGFVLQGRHPIEVNVLEPIPYEAFAGSTAEELTQLVRDRIAAVIEERTRARSPSAAD